LFRILIGHTHHVLYVAYSLDCRSILTASNDGTVRLRDAQTGTELRRFVGLVGGGKAQFSPDGRAVLLAGDDGYTHLWPIDYHEAIVNLCARLVRDFTDIERVQYYIPDSEPTCPQGAVILGPTQTGLPVPILPVWTTLPTLLPPTDTPQPTAVPTQAATDNVIQMKPRPFEEYIRPYALLP
jgi:WD40 repeat protein